MGNRELDIAVAKALGWQNIKVRGAKVWGEPPKTKEEILSGEKIIKDIPLYSTRGNSMLRLAKVMIERGWDIDISNRFSGGWSVEVSSDYMNIYAKAEADSMPEAVAKAALRALGECDG